MKEIKLLSHVFVESSGTVPLDMEAAVGITKEAQDNRKKVIVAGLFVEREVEAIIGFYLFPGPGITEQQTFVAGEILGADTVTFAHKRRLIRSLVNSKRWLEGADKNGFDKGLQWMISTRNAFTHGNIVVRDSIAHLEYFEGERKRVELSDAYWTELETSFRALVSRVEIVKKAAGMPQPAKPDPA